MSKEIQIVPSSRPVETEPKELGANLRIVNGEPYAFYNDENGVAKQTHLDNELPSIGAGDDGKVLGVVDGGYALTNVASGGMENPMTAAGDIIVGGTSGAPARLALGTAGQVLKVNDAGTALEYGSAGSGGLSIDLSADENATIGDLIADITKNTINEITIKYRNPGGARTVSGLLYVLDYNTSTIKVSFQQTSGELNGVYLFSAEDARATVEAIVLYNFFEGVAYRTVYLMVAQPTSSDRGKCVMAQYSSGVWGIGFASPLPDIPDNTKTYTLKAVGGSYTLVED